MLTDGTNSIVRIRDGFVLLRGPNNATIVLECGNCVLEDAQVDPGAAVASTAPFVGMPTAPYGIQYAFPGGMGPYPNYSVPGMGSYWAYYRGLQGGMLPEQNELPSERMEARAPAKTETRKKQEHERERDIKLERRKQANRESARRSKLRRKQESEALHRKAQLLTDEQDRLKAELRNLQGQLEQLSRENCRLMTEVGDSERKGDKSDAEARAPH